MCGRVVAQLAGPAQFSLGSLRADACCTGIHMHETPLWTRHASSLSALFLGALSLTVATQASASDLFLKLNGIDGSSTDAQHAKEIELESYSQSVQSGATFSFGAAAAGKASCGDIVVSKRIDLSSAALIMKVLTGTRVTDGKVTFRRPGKDMQEYYTVQLTDIIVTSVEQADAADAGSIVKEIVKLKARQFRFTYRDQNPDGTLGAVQTFGFDCVSNSLLR
jgi:type VI secretion system secreted protein Hcp